MHLGLSYSSSLHRRLRLGGASMIEAYASEVSAGAIELASERQVSPALGLLGAALEALGQVAADHECDEALRLGAAEQWMLLACDALQLFALLSRREEAEALLARARSMMLVFDERA